MANNLEYVFTCQICFEEFEDTGDHVPRLLPCTHTLCEKCIGKLLTGNSLQCPECRVKHPAERGKKSFPQNKYILVNIQRKPALVAQERETPKFTADLCEKHNRERSLYCTETTCQKPICPLCLKDDHKNHKFDDLKELEAESRKNIRLRLMSLNKNLQSNRAKLLTAKEEINKKSKTCIEKILNRKEEQFRQLGQIYDKLVENASDEATRVNVSLDDDVAGIDETLVQLNNIKENISATTPFENITSMLKVIDDIVGGTKVSGVKKYKYPDYHDNQVNLQDVQTIVGRLTQKETVVILEDVRRETKMKTQISWIQNASQLKWTVTKTFSTDVHDVRDLTLLDDKSVALCGVRGKQCDLKQFSLFDGRQIWRKEWMAWSMSVCKVSLGARLCLAVSFGDENKIEFRAINNLNEIVDSHSVAPHSPGRMCTTSPTTLLYEDLSRKPRSIHWLDCSTLPPKPSSGTNVTHTKRHKIRDFTYVETGGKQLIVVTGILKGIYAYNTNTGQLEWSVEDNLRGKSGTFGPIGVTSNVFGHLFVSNGGCIEMFSLDGVHMGTLVNKEDGLVEPCRICWWSKTSSLAVAHKMNDYEWFVSLVDVEYPE